MMAGVQLLAGERKEGETDRAVLACNDYLRMGIGRSLRDVFANYRQQIANEASTEKPPTSRFETLAAWSTQYGWVERASAYDAIVDTAKTEEINRLRTEGLAADYERIRELDELYQALKDEFNGGKGLWYKDTKLSAKGDTVDVDVFNKALVDSMRGVLDDIAKETGGRKTEVKHGGDKDNPFTLEVRHIDYRDGLTATQE